MNIVLVERTPVDVACMRYRGPLGEPLGRFWRQTFSLWLAEHGLLDCPRYGVTIDDPMKTPPDQVRYDCCVVAPPVFESPDVATARIQGGKYAVRAFRGTDADIGRAWGEFHAAFAAEHVLDTARPPHEHYPRNSAFDARTRTFACELCIPVGS